MGVAKKNNFRGCPCPLCHATSKLLKGNTKKRFFCTNCYIEFTTDDKYNVKKIFGITSSGDTVDIEDWEEK